MSRRVRQRVEEHGKDKVGSSTVQVSRVDWTATSRRVRQRVEAHGKDNVGSSTVQESRVDWTGMACDPMINVFTLLDSADRASLAWTCKPWRSLGASPYLWSSLDLRANKFDPSVAASLAERCADLKKVRFRGLDSASAVCNLNATNLKEISGESCNNMTDVTLAMLVARHRELESLHLGLGSCERITSDAVAIIAVCCPKLKTLRLSGMRDVSSKAIESLANHCPQLSDVGFLDCHNIDEVALGKLVSLRYLSVTGTSNINWSVAAESLEKLPNLTGLDVSRTSIDLTAVSRLLNSSQSLKVVCALNCPILERHPDFNPDSFSGKLLIAIYSNNTLNGMASIFEVNSKMPKEAMHWLEWVLSHTLLVLAETNTLGVNNFWQVHGGKFFVRLMQSTQEDVQERAATGLAAFAHVGNEYDFTYSERADTVRLYGGIQILLKLAGSLKEGFQAEAAKAIAHLSLDENFAKAVDEEGGLKVLVGLAKSRNRYVAEEAAGALWNLSLGDPFKAIAEAGGVNVLVELLSRWPYGYGTLLERATGALANLAGDDKCSMEIAGAGGVHALVGLIRNCNHEGAKAQAARCLGNLAIHDDNNINNAAIGQEDGALETLLQMTSSNHVGVRREAAGALWTLANDDKNRELIGGLGGAGVLVTFARSCLNASNDLQEIAAGALWGLAHSDEHRIAIVQRGGIPLLIALARFHYGAVHETVAGALWNISLDDGNALSIVEEGGAQTLVRFCNCSESKWARFLALLALAYIFDGRLDDSLRAYPARSPIKRGYVTDKRSGLKCIERYIKTFTGPQIFASDDGSSTTPSMSAQDLENIRIPEADVLKCTGKEIGRFVAMLQNPSPVLQTFAAFVLLQFTIPGASHAKHHASLIKSAGDAEVLRNVDAAESMPREAKVFAKAVLGNLEHHHPELRLGN